MKRNTGERVRMAVSTVSGQLNFPAGNEILTGNRECGTQRSGSGG